jgi:hypothetical protein
VMCYCQRHNGLAIAARFEGALMALCGCRATCAWPGDRFRAGEALILTQADELRGVHSTSRTFTAVHLCVSQGGRSASLTVAGAFDMKAVAAVTSQRTMDTAAAILRVGADLHSTPETVGQLRGAASVGEGSNLVAVLTHVGVTGHVVLVRIGNDMVPEVLGATLSRERQLEVSVLLQPFVVKDIWRL